MAIESCCGFSFDGSYDIIRQVFMNSTCGNTDNLLTFSRLLGSYHKRSILCCFRAVGY